MVTTVPVHLVPAHPKRDALTPCFQALDGFYSGHATQQLQPDQRADLERLQQDLQELASLRQTLSVPPEAPAEAFETAAAARREMDGIEARVAQTIGAHQQPGGNLNLFVSGDKYIADLRWTVPGVPAELPGATGISYQMRSYVGKSNLEVCARAVDAKGEGSGHYMKIRCALSELGEPVWSGAEMTLGTPADFRTTSFTPRNEHDREIHHTSRAKHEAWTEAEQAFASNVLKTVGLGWLVPAVCEHCR